MNIRRGGTSVLPAAAHIGGKAAGHLKLAQLGVRVPRSLVLSRSEVARTSRASLQARVNRALRFDEVIIVRSSAVLEDAAHASLAGHYESIVCARRDFTRALDDVVKQGIATTARLTGNARAARSSMAVLVQGVVQSEKAGVCFSRSPLGADDDRAMIVAAWGSCQGVVDGAVATDTFLVDHGSIDDDIAYKLEMTVVDAHVDERYPGDDIDTQLGTTIFHAPYGGGPLIASARVPRHLSGLPALWPEEIDEVVATARKIEKAFGHPVDMEFAFDEGDLVVLQARPITARAARSPTSHAHAHAHAHAHEGRIASPGKATGPARIVKSVVDIDKVKEGDVLVVVATDPGFLPAFKRCVAVVCEEGSPLSHTAIVAREMRLPCMSGIDGATRGRFLDGEIITVDANEGRVVRAAPSPSPSPSPPPSPSPSRASA